MNIVFELFNFLRIIGPTDHNNGFEFYTYIYGSKNDITFYQLILIFNIYN